MTIRDKLLLLFIAIFVSSFLLLTTLVFNLSRNVLSEVDSELLAIAQSSLSEVPPGGLLDVAVLGLPSDLSPVNQATTLMVTVNALGIIVNSSPNLGDSPRLLDRAALDLDLQNPTTSLRTVGQLRVLTVPVEVEDGDSKRVIGYLQIGRQINQYDTYRRATFVVLLVGGAALSASLFVVIGVTPQLLNPIEEIAAVAERITSAEDLARRIPDDGRQDEIGQLTRSINRLMNRLEHLFRNQQRLLADVSHELRTPLTAMRGNLDLLRIMGSADQESLDAIEAEVNRMTRLVEDILTLARADGGGLQLRMEPVDLDTVFLDVFRQTQLLNRPVHLEIEALDQVQVVGDADRLKQLILILADNATKYTPPGGSVSLSLSKDDSTASIIVRDTGMGIAPQDLPHIFDRFYRVDKARTRATGGSGLGLSIAEWIATAHGGQIKVDSEPGIGSEFTVSLPLMTANEPRRRRRRPMLPDPV